MVRLGVGVGVGAALAQPCCSCSTAPAAHLRPASACFLSRLPPRPLLLSSRNSVFLASRLRLRRRYLNPSPRGRRILTQLVRAEARNEEAEHERDESADNDATVTGDEDDEYGPGESEYVFMPNMDGDGDGEDGERVGPISWLKEKFRRKSKEELEAEAEEKSAEVLEVCVRIVSRMFEFSRVSVEILRVLNPRFGLGGRKVSFSRLVHC
jgi:hypothetical protein